MRGKSIVWKIAVITFAGGLEAEAEETELILSLCQQLFGCQQEKPSMFLLMVASEIMAVGGNHAHLWLLQRQDDCRQLGESKRENKNTKKIKC